MSRWTRVLAPMALAVTLGLTAAPAFAQDAPPPPGGEGGEGESGRPLDGYIATSAIAGLILFAVAKSARRS